MESDLYNGISLCHECHKNAHGGGYYANGNPRSILSKPRTGSKHEEVSHFIEDYKESRIIITIPKGRKATVEACAKERGESVNGLVNALLMDAAGLSEAEWKQPPADPLEE